MIIGELVSGDNTWKFILPASSLLAGRVICFIVTRPPFKKYHCSGIPAMKLSGCQSGYPVSEFKAGIIHTRISKNHSPFGNIGRYFQIICQKKI